MTALDWVRGSSPEGSLSREIFWHAMCFDVVVPPLRRQATVYEVAMKKFARHVMALAAALALPMAATAAPVTFKFDPTGGGGGLAYDSFDPSAGSALAVNGNPSLAGNPDGLNGDITQLLFQANLTSGILSGQSSASSLGGNFTVVAGFQEAASLTVVGSNVFASFELAGAPGVSATNFFYIYRSTGDNLSGTGFVSGAPILTGYISDLGTSTYTQSLTPNGLADCATVGATQRPLDCSANGDQWAGTRTQVGGGSTDVTITLTSVNAGYFPDLLPANSIVLGFAGTQLVDPFRAVDPSRQFSTNGTTDANYLANIGAVNGIALPGDRTRDFIFQADAQISFDRITAVPEPASLLLLATSLLGIGLVTGRKRQQ